LQANACAFDDHLGLNYLVNCAGIVCHFIFSNLSHVGRFGKSSERFIKSRYMFNT
jgi:hypothetical protein